MTVKKRSAGFEELHSLFLVAAELDGKCLLGTQVQETSRPSLKTLVRGLQGKTKDEVEMASQTLTEVKNIHS